MLFAAFLGYNPMQQLLGPLLGHLPAGHAAYVTGRQFFPHLITGPFHDGLGVAFAFAIAASLIAAVASLLTGPRPRPRRGARVARRRAGRGGRRRRLEPSEIVATGRGGGGARPRRDRRAREWSVTCGYEVRREGARLIRPDGCLRPVPVP